MLVVPGTLPQKYGFGNYRSVYKMSCKFPYREFMNVKTNVFLCLEDIFHFIELYS
jgi:hypothetical protein